MHVHYLAGRLSFHEPEKRAKGRRINVRAKDLVYIALCCHAIPATRTKAAEEHWPQELVEANAAPDHHAWPSPGVVLHDAVISVTFASSPPHSDTPVHMAHAVAALVSKQNGPPLPPVQLAWFLAHCRRARRCPRVRTGTRAGRRFSRSRSANRPSAPSGS